MKKESLFRSAGSLVLNRVHHTHRIPPLHLHHQQHPTFIHIPHEAKLERLGTTITYDSNPLIISKASLFDVDLRHNFEATT